MIKDPHMIGPGDLFEDASGAVYVVRGVIMEPSITMERVLAPTGNPIGGQLERLHGGCSGLMWNGFTRIRAAKRKDAAE